MTKKYILHDNNFVTNRRLNIGFQKYKRHLVIINCKDWNTPLEYPISKIYIYTFATNEFRGTKFWDQESGII